MKGVHIYRCGSCGATLQELDIDEPSFVSFYVIGPCDSCRPLQVQARKQQLLAWLFASKKGGMCRDLRNLVAQYIHRTPLDPYWTPPQPLSRTTCVIL